MNDQTLNLYQRINEIRKKVDYIQKDKSVSTGGGSYKAVTHDQVTALIRNHMIDLGVICVPSLVASKANDRVGDAKQFRYDATYSFDFVNCDKPDEKLTIVIESHAMDNADKAPGKALSYAKKYAVLKLFEIETGEDEESRYQSEEFDIESIVELFDTAKDEEELRQLFSVEYKKHPKDKDAQKAVIKAKDARKAELAKAAA